MLTRREILDIISKKVGFRVDKSVYAIRVLNVKGKEYEDIYEYQLRGFLGRQIDNNRHNLGWGWKELFTKCLLNMTQMIKSGQVIEELK